MLPVNFVLTFPWLLFIFFGEFREKKTREQMCLKVSVKCRVSTSIKKGKKRELLISFIFLKWYISHGRKVMDPLGEAEFLSELKLVCFDLDSPACLLTVSFISVFVFLHKLHRDSSKGLVANVYG